MNPHVLSRLRPHHWVVLSASVALLLLLGLVLLPGRAWMDNASEGCQGVACVSTAPRLASVDSQQSVLLNATLSSLLGTEVALSLVDSQALAAGDINLAEFLDALQAEADVVSVEEVLAAEVTLADVLQAAVAANGDAALAVALSDLFTATLPLAGILQMGDLLQIETDSGALSALDLNALELVVGTVQLFNYENAITTPTPITLSGAALGVPGLLAVTVQAQVVEPPIIVCGSDGTEFYAAAMRLALHLDLVEVSDESAINIGALLPLLQVEAVVGDLDLYVDVARSAGVIAFVDAVEQAVMVEATPGMVNLYLGHFDPAAFFDRSTPLSPDDLEHGTVGAVDLSVLGLLNLNLGIEVRAYAEGDAAEPDILNFTGPYPQTLTAATGSDVVDNLLADLLTGLGDGGVRLSSSLPPLITNALNDILSFILTNLLTPLVSEDGVLDAVLSEVVDPLLAGMGVGLGEMEVTVLGVSELCPDLAIGKHHEGIFTADTTGHYTLTVSNQGDYSTTAPITVIDALPIGLSYDAHSGDGWVLEGTPDETVTFVHSGAFGPGQALPTLHLTVAVASTLTGTVTNTATVATTGDMNPANDRASDPTAVIDLDPDDDDDGVLDVDDPAPADPCIPDANALACPTGDFDGDGTLNGDDPAPTDSCVPDGNAVACPTGDADGDGLPNSDDPAPTDPCQPDANALACPTGDADGDGTPNSDDPDSSDPCVPNTTAPGCQPTSPLPTPTLPPEIPDVAVYVLQDSDYETPLSDAEKQAMWDHGLPVPDTEVAPEPALAHARQGKPGLLALAPRPRAQTTLINGWLSIFREDFTNELVEGQHGQCSLDLQAVDGNLADGSQDYSWGRNTYHAGTDHASAAWPFAGGSDGATLNPGFATYPESQTTRIICTFSGLSENRFKNVMTEFDLWLDEADGFINADNRGDNLFVGFNTGELGNTPGTLLYRGHRWYSTKDENGNPKWQTYRFHYPELTAAVEANGGVLRIMWVFESDGHRIDSARGAWLDNLNVEKYVQPDASVGCENKDPTIQVTGVPGSGLVSKGLILPPDVEEFSWDKEIMDTTLMTRTTETATNWVRLEFKVQPSSWPRALIRPQDLIPIPETVDLKRYDLLLDNLCNNDISVLGLVDYETVADRSWERDDGEGEISDAYLATFTRTVSLLVDYYGDRIDAWEVWNEPDHDKTGLAATDHVRLLVATYPIIHAANDRMVLGGIANVDGAARTFLAAFYVELFQLSVPTPATPFDVFAIHPYPSHDYTDANGKLLLDPVEHWGTHEVNPNPEGGEFPNVFGKHLYILQGENFAGRDDSDKEIWITEFGWNSAKGSEADNEDRCVAEEGSWVTEDEQQLFLGEGLDFLFKRVQWPDGRPAITKAFWYQFRDTGVFFSEERCTPKPETSQFSASWPASWLYYFSVAADVAVPWSFGLWSGHDVRQPKGALCSFQHYPDWRDTCITTSRRHYLPTLGGEETVSGASE